MGDGRERYSLELRAWSSLVHLNPSQKNMNIEIGTRIYTETADKDCLSQSRRERRERKRGSGLRPGRIADHIVGEFHWLKFGTLEPLDPRILL